MIVTSKILKPTLLIDETKARINIGRMGSKARAAKVGFRPHFKTHQSAEIGEWFRDEGVDKITVSSLTMALFFARHGWDDITVALPFNMREADLASDLSKKIRLNLIVTSVESCRSAERALKGDSGYFIEIDTGYGRSGIAWNNDMEIEEILKCGSSARSNRFRGFLTHAGNTYSARGKEEVMRLFNESNERMNSLRERYSSYSPLISTGDTPGCSLTDSFAATDEIRPGNFVFYDLTQVAIGSCKIEDIAVAVACPVVSRSNINGDIVIYGGGVHLSKESLKTKNDHITYGIPVRLSANGWSTDNPTPFIRSLSQEHGIICDPENALSFLAEGDLVAVLPVHSCMTADAMRSYLTLDGRKLTKFSEK